MSIFEALMLISFGSAWPFSIYKSIKTKQNGSKSLYFLSIILFGYFSGILHKVIYNPDKIIFLYILNFIMVGIEIILFLGNRKVLK